MKPELLPITKNNKVEFYKDGEIYYKKYLSAIKSAHHSIHLQTYIFELDSFGTKVQHELINAAQRGVKIYLLVDSVGSRKLDLETEKKFINCGIHFCRFNGIGLKWLYRWGRRLHHKILLIDEKEGFIGGINILSTFMEGSTIPQLDFAVYISGESTVALAQYCKKIFNKASKTSANKKSIAAAQDYVHYNDGLKIGISVNDWIHKRSKISKQYSEMTNQAQEQITIINSYFFPRKKFMKELAAAAARGVRVRLILPKFSDWPSYILASEYLYSFFLKNNVEIYLWNKSILHGKLATLDNSWSTIGSFNLNYTSYQQNIEMNVDIYSNEFTIFLNNEIDNLINEGCEKISLNSFNEKNTWKIRSARLFFYALLSVIANFSIGLSFQENHTKEHRLFSILRIIGSIFFFILGIIGVLLPIMPGIPFFIISFLLVYKQLLMNKTRN